MRIEVRLEIDTQTTTADDLVRLMTDAELLESLGEVIDRARTELAHLTCGVHNQPPFLTVSVVPPGEMAVDLVGCCETFVHLAKTAFDRGLVQTAYFQPGMKLQIYVEDASEPLVFDFFQIDTLVIGRSVPGTDEVPAIDLRDFDAFQRGISRQHALLFWRNGTLHIADNGSANGTYLNGQRLPPHEPRPLRNHDQIMLGGLALSISLRY